MCKCLPVALTQLSDDDINAELHMQKDGISEQNLDRLQRVQSKAARIDCNAGRQVTSSDVLYSLYWLPVCRRIEFKTATLCFKAVRLGNPPYLKTC